MNMTKEFLALLTQDPQAAQRQIMEDPSSSYWIKQAIVDLCRRDPLDVLYEMDLLLNLFEAINDRLLGFTPHPQSRIRQIVTAPDSQPDSEELFDQYPGEIEIGGILDRLFLPEFLTTLQGASVCLGWNSDLFAPDSEQQLLQALDHSHHLHFYNSLALEGEFDLLETWLVQHQLPFRRTSKGSTLYQAERVEFRRGLTTPQCMTIDGSGQDLIARDELRAVYRYLKEGRPDDATVRLEQVMGVSLQPLPPFQIANTVPCEPGTMMHLTS